jgi:hypothetical protein
MSVFPKTRAAAGYIAGPLSVPMPPAPLTKAGSRSSE